MKQERQMTLPVIFYISYKSSLNYDPLLYHTVEYKSYSKTFLFLKAALMELIVFRNFTLEISEILLIGK